MEITELKLNNGESILKNGAVNITAKLQSGVLKLPKEITSTDQLDKNKFAEFLKEKKIEILKSDSLKVIKEHFFTKNETLTVVDFPAVTIVEHHAFSYCEKLEKVFFSKLKTISEFVFYGCSKLKELNFPEVKIIDKNAFNGCRALVEIIFPEVTSIREKAFKDCTNLKMLLEFNFSKVDIEELAFENCPKLVSDMTCSICFISFFKQEMVRDSDTVYTSQPCKHKFHKRCIIPWYKQNKRDGVIELSCPCCREHDMLASVVLQR